MDVGITICGFFVGVLVGLTGVGAGSLMTPLLISVFNVPLVIAVGTDIVFAALTKFTGASAHVRLGTVDWRLVRALALGSIPSALLSLLILAQIDETHRSTLISSLLAAVLFITATALIFGERWRIRFAKRQMTSRIETYTIIFGAVLGTLVTFTSIGAGALGIVVLRWLYPRLAIAKLVGTDIVHALLLATIAGTGHASQGNVDSTLLIALLIGSIPGVMLGSRLTVVFSETILRHVLALSLVVAAIKLV